jgi:hypothetical protein
MYFQKAENVLKLNFPSLLINSLSKEIMQNHSWDCAQGYGAK